MKRIIVVLLLLTLMLSGCGREARVGLCLNNAQEGLRGEYRATLEDSLGKAGYRVETVDATGEQARQTRQVEEFLAGEADLLVIDPVMQDEAGHLAELCKAAGVPVVFVGYEPEEGVLDRWSRLCYVGLRIRDAAQVQETGLSGGDLNGDGTVSYGLVAGPEEHLDAALWTDALITPGLLEARHSGWTREGGHQSSARLLQQWGKDLEVMLCGSGELALGALDGIRAEGRTVGQDIFLVGLEGDKQSRLLVRSGDLTATVYPDLPHQGELVAKAAGELLSGGVSEKCRYGRFILLTAENIEDYL